MKNIILEYLLSYHNDNISCSLLKDPNYVMNLIPFFQYLISTKYLTNEKQYSKIKNYILVNHKHWDVIFEKYSEKQLKNKKFFDIYKTLDLFRKSLLLEYIIN